MCSFFDTPIKPVSLPHMEGIRGQASKERFVDIFAYSGGTIRVNMQYAKAGISGAVDIAYVRESVAKRLLQAASLLPDGYCFEILDAWRPYEVQLSLFNAYRERILKNAPDDISEEALKKQVCEFVSFPDKNKEISYVHSSGGAVDLTIIGADGKPLDMGSEFDAFSEASYTVWYEENGTDTQVRNNRRLLHNVLCRCGFTNYPAEWWHFDYGDAFWSFYTGERAKYLSVFEIKDVTLCE